MLRIIILIFHVIVLLPVERGEAQPGDSTRGIEYWISGSVGTGTAGLTGVAAGTVDIMPGHLVTGRVAVSREIRFDLLDRTSPHEQTWEAGLLYGRPLGLGRIGRVTAAAGVGVVGGVRRGAYLRTEREVRSEGTKITPPLIVRTDVYKRNSLLTIGMPLELALAFRPVSFLGIGVVAFANVNRIEPFAGAAIQVQLGSWR